MIRRCYVCKDRPARKLFDSTHYRYEATEAVFCSRRCASHYALHAVTGHADGSVHFCRQHGWQDYVFEGEPECRECEVTP